MADSCPCGKGVLMDGGSVGLYCSQGLACTRPSPFDEPQVMPPDFLSKVVAEAVVCGYLRGHNAGAQSAPLPPSNDEIDSMVLEVCAVVIHEFGIQVLP